MKTQIKKIGLLLVTSFSLLNCSKDNEVNQPVEYKPTAQKLRTLRDDALATVTQNFTLASGNNSQQFTSTKGVKFTIIRSNLSLNGNPVTGDINIKFAEIFDGGKMLTTNKTTMGTMIDNNKAIMKSGGEFYINATSGGQQLNLNTPINVEIPSNLTGGVDPAMLLWAGVEDPQGGVDWKRGGNPAGGTNGGIDNQNGTYYTVFNQFGWTNVDRFYSDPRPKTTIQATVPSGYDNTNCSVYLHYDGLGNALARLDTYNTTTAIFSEHYGQIPIGLVCHMIFATEDNGQWRYAIKAVTITAGATYNFSLSETTLGSEAQLVAAINALP